MVEYGPVIDAIRCLRNSDDPEGWGNFIYHGDKPLTETWAIVGPHRNRDSEPLAESNFECIVEDLGKEFSEGDVWSILRSSHWAVGWSESVMCQTFTDDFIDMINGENVQIFIEDGKGWAVSDTFRSEIVEDDLHPVFLWLWEVLTGLEGYPVYDESDLSEREWNEAIDSIQYVVDSWVDLSGDNASDIASFLADEGIYIDCDGCDPLELHRAALHLGFVEDDEDYILDALAFWNEDADYFGMKPSFFAYEWNLALMGQMKLWS